MNEDTKKFNLRLPRCLYQTVQRRAQHEGISMNAWILTRLHQATAWSSLPVPAAAQATGSEIDADGAPLASRPRTTDVAGAG